jgi:3-oxoacyl-[acyl-carrier protein] reductase
MDGIPAYQIMKAGLNMMTQVFARGLATANIRAITISPGVVKTDMHKHLWEQGPAFWQKRNAQIPLGPAVPQQIAQFVINVASEGGNYVNGVNLIIDGGRTVGIANEAIPEQQLLQAKL